MDFASAEQGDDAVADFFQPQARSTTCAMVVGHSDHVLESPESRGMQHVDVQDVALNPFAAVEQAAEQPHCGVNAHPERALDGMHRAHLVGDRADSADARGNIGSFRKMAPAQKGFERTEAVRRF